MTLEQFKEMVRGVPDEAELFFVTTSTENYLELDRFAVEFDMADPDQQSAGFYFTIRNG